MIKIITIGRTDLIASSGIAFSNPRKARFDKLVIRYKTETPFYTSRYYNLRRIKVMSLYLSRVNSLEEVSIINFLKNNLKNFFVNIHFLYFCNK